MKTKQGKKLTIGDEVTISDGKIKVTAIVSKIEKVDLPLLENKKVPLHDVVVDPSEKPHGAPRFARLGPNGPAVRKTIIRGKKMYVNENVSVGWGVPYRFYKGGYKAHCPGHKYNNLPIIEISQGEWEKENGKLPGKIID